MNFKVICLLSLLGVVMSQHGHGHARSSQHVSKHDVPIHGHHGQEKHGDDHGHPKYEFKYQVDDAHTGDHKGQHEHRDGDDTQSSYHVNVDHIVPEHHHH